MKKQYEANLRDLEMNELSTINGGANGDFAELIGAIWVHSTLHVLTFGISTIYAITK